MKKSLIVTIILIVIAVSVALTFSARVSKNNQDVKDDLPITKAIDSNSGTSSSVLQSSVNIPFAIGQKIGTFTVKSIDVRDSYGDYIVHFVGTTTISGVFTKTPYFGSNEDDARTIGGFAISEADLNQIPTTSDSGGAAPDFIYFNNRPIINPANGLDYGQKHTITITNYSLDHVTSEGGNAADFVKVIK